MTEDQENLPLLHPVAGHRRVFAAQNAGGERWVTCAARASAVLFVFVVPTVATSVTRNRDCGATKLAGQTPPYGGQLVPKETVLVERAGWFQFEARRRVRQRARERHARRLLLRHELPAVDALRLRRRPRLVRGGTPLLRASSPTCSASCAATTRRRRRCTASRKLLEAQLVLFFLPPLLRLFERRDGGGAATTRTSTRRTPSWTDLRGSRSARTRGR